MAVAADRTASILALLCALSLLVPAVAFANEDGPSESPSAESKPAVNGTLGGFGLVGLHLGEALTATGGTGSWFDFGGGAEIGLASRRGRLAGRIRVAYYGVLDQDGGLRHTGVLSAGLSVQMLKDIERKFGVYAVVDMGVSPLVTELRVFVFSDLGIGLRFRPVDRVEIFAETTAFFRFEKTMSVGPLVFLGARFRL
jgi:hypothetical protein